MAASIVCLNALNRISMGMVDARSICAVDMASNKSTWDGTCEISSLDVDWIVWMNKKWR